MVNAWKLTREMFLSCEEVDRVLAHVRERFADASGMHAVRAALDRLLIEGLLFSGLRTTEFCHLKVADTMVGRGDSVFVISGMRGRDRTVFVPPEVSELTARFVREYRPALLPAAISADDWSQPLIFGERGRPMQRSGLYRRVVRVLTAAGLGDRASVQLLRHTYGYLAYLRSGGNLLFVQRQLGHAHPMVTSVYAEFVEESYADIAAGLYRDSG